MHLEKVCSFVWRLDSVCDDGGGGRFGGVCRSLYMFF